MLHLFLINLATMKSSAKINTVRIEQASQTMRVLVHWARMEIVKMLLENNEMNATQIQEELKLTQGETSQHLQVLKNLGILKKVRQRQFSIYSVNLELVAKIVQISEDLYYKK
jgi:DNA-binding transcriptional ArsR family regulator